MSVSKLRKAIEQKKNALIKKANKRGIYENFGQKEVMELKDKFNYDELVYGDSSEREKAKLIDVFEDWCMNFDLSYLN